MTRPNCGFVAHPGREFNYPLYEAFASRVNTIGQPFGFRIHEWRRDGPIAKAACEWAIKEHGMKPYVLVVASDRWATRPAPIFLPESVSIAYGNSNKWQDCDLSGDHVEDDSGPVGAVSIMRNRTYTQRVQNFHAYGQSGFDPARHLPTLVKEAKDHGKELVWGECHWGFPGEDADGIKDRPDVVSAGAGAYCRDAVRVAEAHGVKCAMFLPRYFFDSNGEPNASGRVFFGYEDAKPLAPSLRKSLMMSARMLVA